MTDCDYDEELKENICEFLEEERAIKAVKVFQNFDDEDQEDVIGVLRQLKKDKLIYFDDNNILWSHELCL